jgi:hypothetical protein
MIENKSAADTPSANAALHVQFKLLAIVAFRSVVVITSHARFFTLSDPPDTLSDPPDLRKRKYLKYLRRGRVFCARCITT